MVMMSPQTTTTNSAPAERRTSRTGMMWSLGAPLALASVEKLYCVLAIHTGRWPNPAASNPASWSRTLLSATTSLAP